MKSSKKCGCNQTIKESWGKEKRNDINVCAFRCLPTDIELNGTGEFIEQEFDDNGIEKGYQVFSVSIKQNDFPLVTSNYISNSEVGESLGFVFAASNRRMALTVTNQASQTFRD